jgi:hypothetical protein
VPSSRLEGRSCAFPFSSWRRSLECSAGVLLSPTVGGPGLSAHIPVAIIGDPSGRARDCRQGLATRRSHAESLTFTVIFYSANLQSTHSLMYDDPYYVANPFDDHSPGFWDRHLAHPRSGLDYSEGGGVSDDSASLSSSDSEGGSHGTSDSLSLSDGAASSLAVEVLELPSRLAQRQRQHARNALTMHSSTVRDTFSAASPALGASGTPSSAPAGEWVIPPVFAPESPRRVAAEASAVNHMLSTAAYWLASVDIASVPPAVQGELFKLAETCLSATLRFPSTSAGDPIGDSTAPLLASAGEGSTSGRRRPRMAAVLGASSDPTRGGRRKRRRLN